MTEHYHLIGIGGVGMSAIAWVLHERGESVSGSDRQESDITRRLRDKGIDVRIGHDAANVNGATTVVYSAAISEDNPERREAARRGLVTIERCEMLGRLMDSYEHRVAVTGTHGKTTTTSMIAAILDSSGIDATVLVVGDATSLGGNARLGTGSIFVTEACEAFDTFLSLRPSIAAITNVDADHLDYYGSMERIEESFRKFVSGVDEDGAVIACADDARTREVLSGCNRRVVWFGLSGPYDIAAVDVDISRPEATYTLVYRGDRLGEVTLGVSGEHNVLDSLAAAGVAIELGANFESIRDGLRAFHGAGRRFEFLYDENGVSVVDDYAHHPAEVKATLSAARSAYPGRRLIAVFQPHLYSRTKLLADGFAESLALADEVIIAPIYAAREQSIEGVTGELIVDIMRENGYSSAVYAPHKSKIARDLAARVSSGDMVLFLGAGDIRAIGEELVRLLRERC